MTNITRNILDFYKFNEKNSWYLLKFFSNHDALGLFLPYQKDPFLTKSQGTDARTVDEHTTYSINSLGYRGEVYENYDILASGCSITFGIGVPEDARWTNLLGKMANENVMNLGSPGASVESICSNIIQHCLNNSMPKEIFCLFPDFFRNMVVVDKEFYNSRIPRGQIGTRDGLEYIYCNRNFDVDGDYVFMQTEDKKYIEDYTSPHQLIFNAVNAIYILESFCLTNNIKFNWTTWDISTSLIITELLKLENFKLKNFIHLIPPGKRFSYITNSCNSYHGDDFKDNPWWSIGSDYAITNSKKDTSRSHPGIHFQYHVAELFYNLKNKN